MKKILFCAAVVALAAACTDEDDLVMNQDNSRTKGLTFDVALAEGATTKGELWRDENGTYPFFWYAETDKINVFAYSNVNGTNGVVSSVNEGVWSLSNDPATYKATQSSGNGKFTSENADNLISLVNVYNSRNEAGTTTTIVATYGGVKASGITSKVDQDKVVPGELTNLVLTTTKTNAIQVVERANEVIAPMYSVSTAIKEEVYNSLGERANLSLNRPFPVIRFTTKNTKDYIKDFGKLKSVELEALGVLDENYGSVTGTVSTLAYAAGKRYGVISDVPGFETGYALTAASDNDVDEDREDDDVKPSKVTVKLKDGSWSDDDAVYMNVAPVSRGDLNGKEALKVVYEFEKITFTLNPARKEAADFEKALRTSNDWTAVDANGNPNAVTPLPALDINNYNYLVTNGTYTGDNFNNDRTLIVIKGSFNDVFAEKGKVAWNGDKVEATQFGKIISKVALTNAELATIRSFTNLKDLTLAENTAIPAGTLSTTQAGKLISLNLPKVTSVDKEFVFKETGKTDEDKKLKELETLIMTAYGFNDADVNGILLNNEDLDGTGAGTEMGNKKLKTLDISGVTSMMPDFGVARTITFTNYTKLETVTVKDGVIVAPNGFAGCTALKTIKGKLDISGASSAFKMSEDEEVIGDDKALKADVKVNNVLESVEVCGTVIPDEVFMNCTKLATVKYNGSAVVPTAIGESAFKNNIALKHMDLSKAVTIGSAAFKGCVNLVSTSKTNTTLTVGAEKLTESMFAGTGVEMVNFTNATEITGNDVFDQAKNLIQIRFEKVFTLADLPVGNEEGEGDEKKDVSYNNVFGSSTSINFFANPSQTGISGNKLTLSYKTGTGTAAKSNSQTYTFNSIQKK